MQLSLNNLNQKYINIYRLIVCIFGWTSLIILMIVPFGLESHGVLYSYYTFQTNLIALSWLTIALIYYKKENKPKLIHPAVQGAVTLYITIALVIYVTILAPQDPYSLVGIQVFTNLMIHIIIPIAVIIDWVMTGINDKYEWSYELYWTIYPIGYLVYCLILAGRFEIYIYPFFNVMIMGVVGLILGVLGLVIVFLMVGGLYIFINRRIVSNVQSKIN